MDLRSQLHRRVEVVSGALDAEGLVLLPPHRDDVVVHGKVGKVLPHHPVRRMLQADQLIAAAQQTAQPREGMIRALPRLAREAVERDELVEDLRHGILDGQVAGRVPGRARNPRCRDVALGLDAEAGRAADECRHCPNGGPSRRPGFYFPLEF